MYMRTLHNKHASLMLANSDTIENRTICYANINYKIGI